MPAPSMKNSTLPGVSADLGIGAGAGLSQQVQDALTEEEARKKALGLGAQSNVARDLGLSPMNPAMTY
jgi:hypothetical protein